MGRHPYQRRLSARRVVASSWRRAVSILSTKGGRAAGVRRRRVRRGRSAFSRERTALLVLQSVRPLSVLPTKGNVRRRRRRSGVGVGVGGVTRSRVTSSASFDLFVVVLPDLVAVAVRLLVVGVDSGAARRELAGGDASQLDVVLAHARGAFLPSQGKIVVAGGRRRRHDDVLELVSNGERTIDCGE